MIACKSLGRASTVLGLAACVSLPAWAQNPCILVRPNDVLGVAAPPSAGAPCLPPLTRSERLKDYLHSTIGREALLGTLAASGIAQARNSPSIWEREMEGYGARYASRFAKTVANNTIRLGVESALGEDSRYFASPRRETGRRVAHVFRTTLFARKADGRQTLAVGRLAGAFGSGLVSRTWQPEGHNGIGRGLQSGAVSFSFDFASNAFREFWPDLRKRLPF